MLRYIPLNRGGVSKKSFLENDKWLLLKKTQIFEKIASVATSEKTHDIYSVSGSE